MFKIGQEVYILEGWPCICRRVSDGEFYKKRATWDKGDIVAVKILGKSPYEDFYLMDNNEFWYFHEDSFVTQEMLDSPLYKLVIS